jgi:putative membrane protein
LFAGIFLSLFSLAKLIKHLLEFHDHLLWAFFFGLVAASIIYVGKQVSTWSTSAIIGFIVGTVLAYFITQLPPMGTGTETWYIFVCGAIAICAMILPGISGSFILLILGAYEVVITAASDRDIGILGVFALGCLTGLMTFSRLLNWMFKHHKNVTIAVLTGFLLGSISKLWPWKINLELLYTHRSGKEDWLQSNTMPGQFIGDPQLGFCIGLAILGFALIFGMERLAVKSDR